MSADAICKALPARSEISVVHKYRTPVSGPPCSYCVAKESAYRLDVKVSWFRGDDERRFVCADCYRRISNG